MQPRRGTMQPVGQVIPRVLADIVRAAPLSPGKVEFAWRAAVGTATARASHVRLEGTTVLVEAQSRQWGAAIMRSSPIILSRLKAMLGEDSVSEIRFRA